MSYDSGSTSYDYVSSDYGSGDFKEYTNQYGEYTHIQGEVYDSDSGTTSYVDTYIDSYSGK